MLLRFVAFVAVAGVLCLCSHLPKEREGYAMRVRDALLVFVILALICGTGCKSGGPEANAPSKAPNERTLEQEWGSATPIAANAPSTAPNEWTQFFGTPTAQCGRPPAFDQKSIAAFEQQASSGNAAAQCGLGVMYAIGGGVPQDYTQAASWWRKAAEQGSAAAQYFLGGSYHEGRGVPQDYAKAALWRGKAAGKGIAMAQAALGASYFEGIGVPQDDAQAAFWFRKAAEQGNAEAEFMLGNLYAQGRGVPQHDAQMAALDRKAAEQGFAPAQNILGAMYVLGQNVPQDYAEAYFWFDLAAAGRLSASQAEQTAKYRDEAMSHLTPADLS